MMGEYLEEIDSNYSKETTKKPKIMTKNKQEKTFKKFRSFIVILSLMIIAIIILFIQRAEYLNYIEAGSQYLKIYWSRTIERAVVFSVNFIVIYFAMFFVTKNMQKNLKELFKIGRAHV